MTPNAAVYSTLSEVCPGAYLAYAPGSAPPLPWFVYKRRRGGETFADNDNYAQFCNYRVELFFKEHDPYLISDFEEALHRLGTYTLYDADYLDTEGCLMHDYRLAYNPNKEGEAKDG